MSKSSDSRFDEALATLLSNTRTTRRHVSLMQMAQQIRVAEAFIGDIKAVADRIGLSTKMLRQFLAIEELTARTQKLFEQRKLDSVDAAAHLKKLAGSEQETVANAAANGKLSTADIRAVCEFKRDYPDATISEAIERVLSTKNVKQYVLEFVLKGPQRHEDDIHKSIIASVGEGNLVSFDKEGAIVSLTLSNAGRKSLRETAKKLGLTTREAIQLVAKGGLDK